uniref:adhesion G protein-coupled receptor E1-like n=1 Tax=Pristiophorus japonicus TaxID=55135 RepID=UPI00398F3013
MIPSPTSSNLQNSYDNECGGGDNTVIALCGANTECHNTPGSYYCTCKKGYFSPSGTTNFKSRTNCHDIDECVDTTRVCGSNATCSNTMGGFYCTCAGGFVPNNGELTFTDITKAQCQDIDECVDTTRVCGSNATCSNTMGGFYCTCAGGFVSNNGDHTFTDITKVQCQDIDECVDTTRVCGSNAICNNTMGGFYCTCAGGFVSNNGELTFTDITKAQCQVDKCVSNTCGINQVCRNTPTWIFCDCIEGFSLPIKGTKVSSPTPCVDIDECLVDPCGPHGICRNTQGSFTCEGAPTQSTTSSPTEIDLIKVDMEQCSLNNSPEAGQSPRSMFHAFCSLINSTNSLINQTWQNQTVALPLQQIISTTNDLLGNDSLWDGMERKERLLSVSIFLQSMEKLAIVAVLHSPGDKLIRNSSENIDLEARVFRGENSSAHDRVSLQAKGTVMDIYRRTVTGGTATDVAAVALIAYKNMDSILNGSVFNLSTAGGKPKPFRLISNVVSATITNRDKHGLDPTVNFTFKHTEEAIRDWTMHCVHWNYAAGKSYWSPSGCTVGASNGTETQCRCNHLSSLALLMTPFKRQDDPLALTVITFIGIPVSLVCLGITFVTFAFCSNLKNAINTTHTQLCASLFLAELLFIVGINRTGNRVVCGIVAGFLHYFFLAAFVWMFLEGVQLFLMVRNIRQLRAPHSEKTGRYMYSCGYGVPAVIVVISAAVYHDGYGSPRHCWISTDRGLIWSFLGPVCLIIVVNTLLFLTVLWILKKEVSKRDTQVSKLQDTRMLTFKAIAQVFILGCTWIFGLLQFQVEAGVMAYLFTIVNSFQGTFIFIILCVLNPKVRAEYRKWFAKTFRAKDRSASPEDIGTTMTAMSNSDGSVSRHIGQEYSDSVTGYKNISDEKKDWIDQLDNEESELSNWL